MGKHAGIKGLSRSKGHAIQFSGGGAIPPEDWPNIFLQDSFTEGSDTPVGSHVIAPVNYPDVLYTTFVYGSTEMTVLSADNQCDRSFDAGQSYAGLDTLLAQQVAEVDITIFEQFNYGSAGLMCRIADIDNNFEAMLVYVSGADECRLYEKTSGVKVQRGSFLCGAIDGVQRTLTLDNQVGSVNVSVSGSGNSIAYSSTAKNTNTIVGFGCGNTAQSVGKAKFDNYELRKT